MMKSGSSLVIPHQHTFNPGSDKQDDIPIFLRNPEMLKRQIEEPKARRSLKDIVMKKKKSSENANPFMDTNIREFNFNNNVNSHI